jgi:hypothetical protein
MPRVILRLQALLLAAIFVAGSFGLPEADVLLDHRIENGPTRTQIHIEGRGGCSDHSDHCVLGRLLADLRNQAPANNTPATPISETLATPEIGADRFTFQRLDLSYRSRAPPTLIG